MSDDTAANKGGLSNWLLVLSAGANLVFAGLAAYTTYQNSMLDVEKKRVENELLFQKHTPAISTFYIIVELSTLRQMMRGKEPLPFSQEIKHYRFAQNDLYDQFSSDLASKRGNGLLTFLSIANISDVAAYGVSVQAGDGSNLGLGDLEPKTAVLIITSYKISAAPGEDPKPSQYSKLRYEVRAAGATTVEKQIDRPGNPTWSAQIGNVKSWGRALPDEDSDPLKELLGKN